MAQIIDGKKIAADVKAQVREEVEALKAKGAKPGLAVVLVGNNPASRVYVSNKEKDCAECGFASYEYALPEETTEAELLELVDKLNSDPTVNGILVQLPLPKQICEQTILHAISPAKDVDAFHPENVGHIMIGDFNFLPCTPAGVIEMLDAMNIEIAGKHCVVIGRSNIVGKPMAMLLLHRNGTVTVCHSRTKDLAAQTRQADILVAAVGRAGFVTADMVKEGAVVIDVGMNRNAEGKLCGDVCYDEVAEKASAITPVPGGVGPMTRAILMRNTLTAAKMQFK
ncbi:MAG: bifunctional methylenetetrahydrofolate dehydrogenase/methenyltetrahydrofolate cyclohydrolase FolD [Oscillospiraceae bacterium]|nr:bifunctional methylenetetrahydrofolate dehydrogenase/methenyltetrahydrofolate cyclohydrolase FolD [Oscillospiraceae bacterium]